MTFRSDVPDGPRPREEKRLIDLLNDDSEARANFDAVNRRYPDGFLATIREAGRE